MSQTGLRELALQGVEIRPLDKRDLPQVLEIEGLCHSHPWPESVFLDCFHSHYRLWALVCGEMLQGYAIVNYMVDEAHLLNICVHPGLRGCGAGRYLLRYALAESVRDGMTCMILEVRESNQAAASLYSSEGFEQIGLRPGYYPDGGRRENARVMSLRFT